jgi:hypothetical protein
MSALRLCILLSCAVLFWATSASAGPGYSATGVSVKAADAAKLVAAFDKLNASPVMKDRKSRALLLANVADGVDPASHTLVVLSPSIASSEAFREKLLSDPAWAEWTSTLSSLATITSTARFQTLKSWGDLSDADVIWESFTCTVTDPAAFIAAHDRFMASAQGKAAPGQVHVVAVAAGGGAPFTHAIDVGWASEAEMEAWRDGNATNADWLAYLDAASKAGTCSNASLSRVLTASGVSMKAALGR